MRIRTQDYTESTYAYNIVNDGPQSAYIAPSLRPSIFPSVLLTGTLENMEDVVGQYEDENPCYHFCSTSKWTDQGIPFEVKRTTAPAGVCIYGILKGPGAYHSVTTDWAGLSVPVNHPSTSDLDDRNSIPNLSYEGWMNVYPVIRERLKLVNSIYELKDFSRLPALLRETRRGYKDLDSLSKQFKWVSEPKRRGELRLMYKLLSPQSPATWSYLLKLPKYKIKLLSFGDILSRMVSLGKVSAAHLLNWKFAVEPLLRDMGAFSSASRSVAAQLPGLLARADGDTVHKSHWSKTLDYSEIEGLTPVTSDEADWVGPISHVYFKSWSRVSDGPTYTFTARYSYKYAPEVLQFAEHLAIMDAYGINLSAANVWQATRWTFIVDWFLKVGNFLEQFTPHNLEPIVHFYGASHSLKYAVQKVYEIKSNLDISGADYTTTGFGEIATVATMTDEYYIRRNVVPFVSLPKTSDFSTMEKLLALALGLSSVRYTTQ